METATATKNGEIVCTGCGRKWHFCPLTPESEVCGKCGPTAQLEVIKDAHPDCIEKTWVAHTAKSNAVISKIFCGRCHYKGPATNGARCPQCGACTCD